MDFYSDNDRHAAAWMRELIREGHLPNGEVDETDIRELQAEQLRDFRRVHLFAGIGGWAYALDLAGWPPTRPVWTGSCPCQPFSDAGQQKADTDPRHLWPVFFRLIRECKPATIFGEQVASKLGRSWLARVRSDLESLGYAVGCADLPAACVSAPHRRSRLWWVADSTRGGCREFGDTSLARSGRHANSSDASDLLANSELHGTGQGDGQVASEEQRRDRPAKRGESCRLAETERDGGRRHESQRGSEGRASFWGTAQAIILADGKARRIEPSVFPLVDGLPGRVGLLRGAGNAIVPQVAAEFIKAYLETEQ